MYFAQNIKYLRKKEKLSQDQLAENFDLSRGAITGYENGKSKPKFEDFLKIADFFGVSLDDLVYRNMEEEGPGELLGPPAGGREGLREEIKELIRQMKEGGEI